MVLPLIGLAAGIARGYGEGKQREREQARQDENDAWTREERDAIRQERQQQSALRRGLSDAVAPASMAPVEGSVLPEDQAGPSLALYRVKGSGINQVTADQGQATQAMTDYNAPEAVAGRLANAYRAAGAPDKAMSLEGATLDRKRSNEKYSQEQADRLRKLKEEGIFDAVRAFRMGDASGLVKAFNSGGEYKIDGTPELVKEDRDVPGLGKIPSYTAKIRVIGPDGQAKEQTYNSHDLSMQIMPFEKQVEQMRAGKDAEYKDRKTAADEKKADAYMLRAERMGLSGAGSKGQGDPLGGDKLTISRAREKRLDIKDRISTVLKKRENDLISDKQAREQIKDLEQQQAKYDKIIEDDEDPVAPKPGAARGSSAIPAPASKAEYDKLPKGAQYRHPSGDVRIKG